MLQRIGCYYDITCFTLCGAFSISILIPQKGFQFIGGYEDFSREEAGRVVGKMVIRKYAFHGRGINVLGTTRCFYVLISCYPGSEPGFSFWLSFFLHSVTNRHLVFTAHASLMHAYGRLRRRLLRHITEVVVVKRIPWFLGRWNHIQTNTPFAVDQH